MLSEELYLPRNKVGSSHLIRFPHSGEQLTQSMQNSRSSEGALGKGLGTGCYSLTQLEYVDTHGCSHRTHSTHCNPLEWNGDNRKGLHKCSIKLRSSVCFLICGAYCIIIECLCTWREMSTDAKIGFMTDHGRVCALGALQVTCLFGSELKMLGSYRLASLFAGLGCSG